MNSRPYFYLLYKIISSPNLWIVTTSEDVDYLYDKIDNVKSTEEEYYLIKRNIYNKEEFVDTKQFTIFKQNKHDIIIAQTKKYK
tara:strand:+ start:9327 stop:9578 length:252 start_codon:yes stop_codon:yes gene_type:complete